MYVEFVLIDLTSYPPILLPDECPEHLVARTRASHNRDGVTGTFTRKESYRQGSPERHRQLDYNAKEERDNQSLYETNLPLDDEKGPVFKDFWEVPTVAKDLVTQKWIVWRAAVRAHKHPANEQLWIVEVLKVDGPPVIMIATKNLSLLPLAATSYPLNRAAAKKLSQATDSIWARLTND